MFPIIIIVLIIMWLLYRHFKKLTTIHIDQRGYERNGYDRLVHRDIAFREVYDYPNTHSKRFSEYVVHHIDGNKRNNSADNLQVITQEEHKKIHGF